MPEGHTLHRLADAHDAILAGHTLGASSPQGRFAEGAARLDGQRCTGVEAYGKHLFYDVPAVGYLHVHLGLYGKFAEGTMPPPEPRGALRLRLTAGEQWLDLRGATACELITPPERAAIIARLGPDPLVPRPDGSRFLTKVGSSRAPIGGLLMDQAVLAGVGNVYRAEVLFRAGTDPYAPGRDLAEGAATGMWSDIVTLMRAGVRAGRIVTTRPQDRSRRTGAANRADATYVYRRTGQPCRIDETPIRTAEMVGRNLFWCPTCQAGRGEQRIVPLTPAAAAKAARAAVGPGSARAPR